MAITILGKSDVLVRLLRSLDYEVRLGKDLSSEQAWVIYEPEQYDWLMRYPGKVVLWVSDGTVDRLRLVPDELLNCSSIAYSGGSPELWQYQLYKIERDLGITLPDDRMYYPLLGLAIAEDYPTTAQRPYDLVVGMPEGCNLKDYKAILVKGGDRYTLPYSYIVIQGWVNGCLTFIDPLYDNERLVYKGNQKLYTHLRTSNTSILAYPDICTELVAEQLKYLAEAVNRTGRSYGQLQF